MADGDLLREMGRFLWSIFDEKAAKVVLYATSYPEHRSDSVEFIRSGGSKFWFEINEIPRSVLDEIGKLVVQLQQTPPFDTEPFTHMKYTLTEDSKMDVKFAYIPEWDSWPGLYMTGVSQVPKDKLVDNNIPPEAWKECHDRFERERYTLPKV